MGQCDTNIDLNIYIGQWPIWSRDFALYNEHYLKDEGHIWDNGSVWNKDWHYKICTGQWPIFHGPVCLHYILKTIWWMHIILEMIDHFDTKSDLAKNTYVSDLFHGLVILLDILKTVRWMGVILGIMDQFDTKVNDLYIMVQWFCLIFVKLVGRWMTYFGLLISLAQWPIFHGPVIVFNILKTF